MPGTVLFSLGSFYNLKSQMFGGEVGLAAFEYNMALEVISEQLIFMGCTINRL